MNKMVGLVFVYPLVFVIAMVLSIMSCSPPSPKAKTLCVHPFVNGGQPTVLSEDAMTMNNGQIVFTDGDRLIRLNGALCITVGQK